MSQSSQNNQSIAKSRVVRVFVSSTFRDMHDEREQLVKFIFPELRRRCRQRGVELVEVDLRWGITSPFPGLDDCLCVGTGGVLTGPPLVER
jgi:hypothetical protein